MGQTSPLTLPRRNFHSGAKGRVVTRIVPSGPFGRSEATRSFFLSGQRLSFRWPVRAASYSLVDQAVKLSGNSQFSSDAIICSRCRPEHRAVSRLRLVDADTVRIHYEPTSESTTSASAQVATWETE